MKSNLPSKFKAAILAELNSPLVIDQISGPDELDYGQVSLKIQYASICGSQIGEISGAKGEDKYLPHLLGHEAVAEVIGVGHGVKSVRIGDTVVLHWRPGKGLEGQLPRYTWRGRPLNAGHVTAFNEYSVVSENRVTSIPKNTPARLAPLFGCAVLTGFGIVTNDAKVKIGESIIVIGAGGIGLSVIQGASLSGAYPIVAVDINNEKLELAKRMGATHLVNSTQRPIQEAVKTILGDQGADVVIENTGLPSIIRSAYDLTSAQGRTILVGVPRAGAESSLYTLPLHFGKVLTGSHGGAAQPSTDIPKFLRLMSHGFLKLDAILTDETTLGDINSALDKIRDGKVTGRCLVKMEG